MDALGMISTERQRQITELGYTIEHDDGHVDGEIAVAAADYALPSQNPHEWSWAKNKAKSTRIDQLVKAGALIVAEIERLRRAEVRQLEDQTIDAR